MDLVASCKEKLSHFRIRELKGILTQLGLSKQGKKQVKLGFLCLLFVITSTALICVGFRFVWHAMGFLLPISSL
ncbi:putative transcription regulator SAP family [Helianthus debilis subsp. tardiflorus]